MKMESCIKIGKPIQTLFDKDKKKTVTNFFAIKFAKQSYLFSLVFFFFLIEKIFYLQLKPQMGLTLYTYVFVTQDLENHRIRFKEKR